MLVVFVTWLRHVPHLALELSASSRWITQTDDISSINPKLIHCTGSQVCNLQTQQ